MMLYALVVNSDFRNSDAMSGIGIGIGTPTEFRRKFMFRSIYSENFRPESEPESERNRNFSGIYRSVERDCRIIETGTYRSVESNLK
jgi:hypothetical protein